MTDLTDEEIDSICQGYTQHAAKVRYLRRMGLTVRIKPNGKPLVNRKHYDEVMNPNTVRAAQSGAARGPAWSVAA